MRTGTATRRAARCLAGQYDEASLTALNAIKSLDSMKITMIGYATRKLGKYDAGFMLSTILNRRFCLDWRPRVKRLRNLVGGVLMGFALALAAMMRSSCGGSRACRSLHSRPVRVW